MPAQQPTTIGRVCEEWDYSAHACASAADVQQIAGTAGCFFLAKMAIDADGAPRAYHPGEYYPSNTHQAFDWLDNLSSSDNHGIQAPSDVAPGYVVSGTTLTDTADHPVTSTRCYVDASRVPYIVLTGSSFPVPSGATLKKGCLAFVVDTATGNYSGAIYADVGRAVGEASLALALMLGINPFSRAHWPKVTGGVSQKRIFYLVFPNDVVPAPWRVDDIQQRALANFRTWGGEQQLKALFPRLPQMSGPRPADIVPPPPAHRAEVEMEPANRRIKGSDVPKSALEGNVNLALRDAPASGGTGGSVDLDGFVLYVQRVRTELRRGEGYPRTVGTYSAFFNRQPVPGVGGMSFERQGPGDNTANGSFYHRRVKAGTYPLLTQDGSHYKTWHYRTDDSHPRPGVLIGDTGHREGCLFHPGGEYLRSTGCINLSKPLGGANDDMDPFDCRDHVIAVIEAMKAKLGAAFPPRNGLPIPNAFLVIEGEPANVHSLTERMLEAHAASRSIDAGLFAEATPLDRFTVLGSAMNGQVLPERISAELVRRLSAHAGDLKLVRGEFNRTLWSEWTAGWESTLAVGNAASRAQLQNELKRIAELLLHSGVDINDRMAVHTPAVEAAMAGFTDALQQLVGMGADLNQRDAFGYTPLTAAAFRGELGAVRYLTAAGADANIKTAAPQTAGVADRFSEACAPGSSALDCARAGLQANGVSSGRRTAEYQQVVAILTGSGGTAPVSGWAAPSDLDPAAPAKAEAPASAKEFEAAKLRANFGDANPRQYETRSRPRATPRNPPSVMPLDIGKAQAFLTACVTSTPRVIYGFGSKIHHPPEHPVPGHDFIRVDCSGFVREAIRLSTTPPLTGFPDGSVVQHEWVIGRGYRPTSIDDAKNNDGKVRIAFLDPSDSPSGIGHVALIYNGRTLESHGHVGPDSRAWTGQDWQGHTQVYMLT